MAGYRMLRRIASGDRADVYLAVVASPDDESGQPDGPPPPRPLVVLRVYGAGALDDAIAAEIEVMASDTAGATPALLDVANLDDGRTCLAVERIPGSLLTELLGERSITAGEAVTLLAPIVQAVHVLERRGFVHTRLSAADVLLDGCGRPRLIGLGAVRRLQEAPAGPDRVALLRAGHTALLRLAQEVAAVTRPEGALARSIELIEASLADRPFASCTDALERALFATATPAPVSGIRIRERTPPLPARITPASLPLAASTSPEAPDPALRTTARGPRIARLGSIRALAQLPDGFLDDVATGADRVSTRSLRAGLARLASGRRRTVAVGGLTGAAALVVLLALVPPGTATSSMAASGGAASPAVQSAEPAAQPSTAPKVAEVAAVAGEVDPTLAAAELLEVRASCLASRDAACLAAVDQPGSPLEAADRAVILDGETHADSSSVDRFDLGAIALVADMGSAVLVEVPSTVPEREPASLLMMRSEAGWRLRELFD